VGETSPQHDLRKAIASMLSGSREIRTQMEHKLGRMFLRAAEQGQVSKLMVFIQEGFPVNYQDPSTGETALHIVAASRARRALRAILKTGQCDFLLRDRSGRLSSEMAYLHGGDVAVARLLGMKERKQASAQGIKLTRRP
jgi:Ankyrin repeats (many copies)